MNNLMSMDRKPLDHFVSGALIGGFTSIALNYKDVKDGKISSALAAKKILKLSLIGGVAAGAGIHASNSLVRKNYVGFISTSLLAVGSIIVMENLVKA